MRYGLIGPRELPRIWDRHLLNGAAIGALIPRAVSVADVGSGAGLPGLALAIARPDLSVTLVDAAERRIAFLRQMTAQLDRPDVQIVRGRVDGTGPVVVDARGQRHPVGPFDVVTARAVAPLVRLLPWLAGLARPGGLILAIKGESARAELSVASGTMRDMGGIAQIVQLGMPGAAGVQVVRIDLTGAAR